MATHTVRRQGEAEPRCVLVHDGWVRLRRYKGLHANLPVCGSIPGSSCPRVEVVGPAPGVAAPPAFVYSVVDLEKQSYSAVHLLDAV